SVRRIRDPVRGGPNHIRFGGRELRARFPAIFARNRASLPGRRAVAIPDPLAPGPDRLAPRLSPAGRRSARPTTSAGAYRVLGVAVAIIKLRSNADCRSRIAVTKLSGVYASSLRTSL